jgi:hypothetical protein
MKSSFKNLEHISAEIEVNKLCKNSMRKITKMTFSLLIMRLIQFKTEKVF